MNALTKSSSGVLLALALAGCTPEPASQPSPPPPEPTPERASVAQFASVVSRHDAAIRKIATEDSSCFIDMILDKNEVTSRLCATSATNGRNAAVELKDQLTELGPPPAEISELVSRLVIAGNHIEDTEEFNVEERCADIMSEACSTAAATVAMTMEEVIVPELDAWKPYIS